MKRTSISYTDDISGLSPLTYLVATIGETKIMEAEYTLADTCILLDNTVIQYNPAMALNNPRMPTSDNFYRITVTSATVVGTWYDMQLLVNGSSQGAEYFSNNNVSVQFKKNTDNTFTIKHEFYIVADVNGYVAENGSLDYNRWFQIADNQSPNIVNNGSSMYDSNKFFVKHLKVIDIATQTFTEILDFDKVEATFYDLSPLANTFVLINPTSEYVVDLATQTSITFNNVTLTNTPTSAKLILINPQASDTLTTINPSIIEDSATATLTHLGGHNWAADAPLTALTASDKEIILIVYYNAIDGVASSKARQIGPTPGNPTKAVIGCYPTITTSYNDYNNTNIGTCINSAPLERVSVGFKVSKTSFNNVGSISIICYPHGFDTYNKTGSLKLTKRSTGETIINIPYSYNASSGVWTTGGIDASITFSQDTSFLYFSYMYRNLVSYVGEFIDAIFTMNIFYSGIYFETVISQSTNYVNNFDQSNLGTSKIHSIKVFGLYSGTLYDRIIGNVVTLSPSCVDKFNVEVMREASTLTDDYTIIPVLYEVGSNRPSEENVYIGNFPTLSSPYFSGVPTSFGVGNAFVNFTLDMSSLDKTASYNIGVIIKKV